MIDLIDVPLKSLYLPSQFLKFIVLFYIDALIVAFVVLKVAGLLRYRNGRRKIFSFDLGSGGEGEMQG